MENENQLYERYMNNKKGEKESVNSYNTFIDIYLPTNPSPTYKKLAKLSGYKETTCRKWIEINEYRKRKQEIIEYEAKEKKRKEQELKDNFLSEFLTTKARTLKMQNNIHSSWVVKEKQELQANSTSPQKPYDLLDVESNKYDKLRQLNKDNINNDNKLMDTVMKFKDLHAYDKTENIDKTVMDDLSERAEEIRFYDNKEKQKEIEEQYKNDDF